jgi:opacity protein-like surface antigen
VTQRIRVLFFISVIILTTAMAFADDEKGYDIDLGIKTVVFFYNDEQGVRFQGVDGWSFGGELILWLPQGFGLGAELEYYTMTEDIDVYPGVSAEIKYVQYPININAYYRFLNCGCGGLVPYIGGGLSFVNAKVSASTAVAGMDFSFDVSDTFTGFTIFAGANWGRFFFEAQWLQVDANLGIEGMLGDSGHSEASGLSLWLGFRF